MPKPTHITGGESLLQAVGQQDRARSPSSSTASNYNASSMSVYVIEWSGRESLKAAPSWPVGPEPEREAALSARLLLLDSESSEMAPLSVDTLTSWPVGPDVNENFLILSLAQGFRTENVHTALVRADSSASTLSDSKRARCCPIGGSFSVYGSDGSVLIARTGNAESFDVVETVNVRPSTYDSVVPHLSLSRRVRDAAVLSSICVTPGYECCALDEAQTLVGTTLDSTTPRVSPFECATVCTWTPRNADRARSPSESSGGLYTANPYGVALYMATEPTVQLEMVPYCNLDIDNGSRHYEDFMTVRIWDITGSTLGSIVPPGSFVFGKCRLHNEGQPCQPLGCVASDIVQVGQEVMHPLERRRFDMLSIHSAVDSLGSRLATVDARVLQYSNTLHAQCPWQCSLTAAVEACIKLFSTCAYDVMTVNSRIGQLSDAGTPTLLCWFLEFLRDRRAGCSLSMSEFKCRMADIAYRLQTSGSIDFNEHSSSHLGESTIPDNHLGRGGVTDLCTFLAVLESRNHDYLEPFFAEAVVANVLK